MTSAEFTYDPIPEGEVSFLREGDIESNFIGKLRDIKYTVRAG